MESLARFPMCIACNQGIDTNDPEAKYTIANHEYAHLRCSAVTEFSAAYAREVRNYLTIGKNATRPANAHPLLDEAESEELVECYLLGISAVDFAKRLESRDVSRFESMMETERVFPNAENE
jgi:hypothetical protein